MSPRLDSVMNLVELLSNFLFLLGWFIPVKYTHALFLCKGTQLLLLGVIVNSIIFTCIVFLKYLKTLLSTCSAIVYFLGVPYIRVQNTGDIFHQKSIISRKALGLITLPNESVNFYCFCILQLQVIKLQ